MGKVFLEYKISQADREEFVSWVRGRLSLHGSAEIYEGTDQPGLFVELWEGLEYEGFVAMKKIRLDPAHPEWGRLHRWVAADKLHIWHFGRVG